MKYNEFKDYLKINGITLAITTDSLMEVPKGTKLYFTIGSLGITSSSPENRKFYYNFDYSWNNFWRDRYKGEFIVFDRQILLEQILNNYV